MPILLNTLQGLIKSKVDAKIKSAADGVPNYNGPLATKDPSYFIEMCDAIGVGIFQSSQILPFVTVDSGFSGAPPVPGVGTGVGLNVDQSFLTEQIYTKVRDAIIAKYGKTAHDPWPPRHSNTGRYLRAFSDGIAEAVTEHFSSCWTLTSAHPLIYSGTGLINYGLVSHPNKSMFKPTALDAAPRLKGEFWPIFVEAVSDAYHLSITTKTKGQVTIVGVCVPTVTPLQTCGIPSSGSGTGTAS